MRSQRFDHDAILQRIREGTDRVLYTDIAEEFGCSNALVRKVAKKAGVPPLRSGMPRSPGGHMQPAYWYDWLASQQAPYCAWPTCTRPKAGPRDVDHDHRCCSKEKLGHERICGKCIRGLVHKGCNVEIAVIEKAVRLGAAVVLGFSTRNYLSSRVKGAPDSSELAWKYQNGPCGQCDACKSRFKCTRRSA